MVTNELLKVKERYGIRILSVSGESLSCNIETAASFVNIFKRIMAENGFLPDQIYNCDKTGLVYKGLHKKTNVANFEKSAAGRKVMKEGVTIMPCVNATGMLVFWQVSYFLITSFTVSLILNISCDSNI